MLINRDFLDFKAKKRMIIVKHYEVKKECLIQNSLNLINLTIFNCVGPYMFNR